VKCLSSKVAIIIWVKRTSVQLAQLFERVAQNYSFNDVSIIFVHWPTVHISTKQKERSRDKTPAHTINVQSLMASVGESQVVDITPVWYLPITESRLVRSINRNICCYNSSCASYVRSQVSSSSFIRTVPRRTWRLRQSAFPHNFAKCCGISKILSKQTHQ